MKIKIFIVFSCLLLIFSCSFISVSAYSVVEDSTLNEQSQTLWGYNMFDRQRYTSSQNITQYVYLDNQTYTNQIAFEGGYPLFTAISSFFQSDVSVLAQNSYMNFSPYVYDFSEGNYVQRIFNNYYYYSYLSLENDTRAVYFDYARFDTSNVSMVDLVGLWAYERRFYWDTLLLNPFNSSSNPYLLIFDARAIQNIELPTIDITWDFDIYNYDIDSFEHRTYNEVISFNSYLETFYFNGEGIPMIHYPLFEVLDEYAELPTFITNLEIIIDASEYSDAYNTIFNCFSFSLTNETNNDLWEDLAAFTPPSIVENDIDFVNWLVRGVSGVFDTELIPGISMGNILKLILSIALVIAVLRYFVGG